MSGVKSSNPYNGTSDSALSFDGIFEYQEALEKAKLQLERDQLEADRHVSSNNLEAFTLQVKTQELALQQATLDSAMRQTAFLTAAMDGMDTKLQIAQVNFRQDVFVESNRHVEKMTEVKLQAVEARRDRFDTDIPEPDFG